MITKIILLVLDFFDFFHKKKIKKFFIQNNKRDFNVIFDIGAHKGETILFFLKNFNLPRIEVSKTNSCIRNWNFLKNYKNSISTLKMNINLYYKFSNKLPSSYTWYSLDQNKEFIPSFTKKIFRQVTTLF